MRWWKLALFLALAAAPWYAGAASAADPACEAALGRLVAAPGWFEQLYNPVLTSREAVAARRELMVSVAGCLEGEPAVLPEEIAARAEDVRTLAELFVAFADDSNPLDAGAAPYSTEGIADAAWTDRTGTLLAPFGDLRDPAVDRFQAVGLPPPPGLIYIRFFESPYDVPEVMRGVFANEDVRAAVLYSRFVAVLMRDGDSPAQSRLLRDTLPRTISHELVHAYVNATLGSRARGLPVWFHEGCAIHFSGSSEYAWVTYDDGASREVAAERAPKDYRQYGDNFGYLESRLGGDAFHRALRESILSVSPLPLLQPAGISSYEDLVPRGEQWGSADRAWAPLRRAALIVGLFVGGLVLAFVVIAVVVTLGKAAVYTLQDRRAAGSAPAPAQAARREPARAPATVTTERLTGAIAAVTPEGMRAALRAFVRAGTLEEARALAEANPALISAEAAEWLANVAAWAQTGRAREAVERRRALILRSMAVGAELAFAEADRTYMADLRQRCGRALAALLSGDERARLALEEELAALASGDLPAAGARDFLRLLAAWLRGEDVSALVAALDERFRRIYERMAALAAQGVR